jgi:MtN3 and saliva related transmembrane protein
MGAFDTIPNDMLGYAAGALTTIAFFPQLLRIATTRSADDISWWMFGLFTVGIAFWLWYGIRVDAMPLIIANVVTMAQALAIMVLKWRFGREIESDQGAFTSTSKPQAEE